MSAVIKSVILNTTHLPQMLELWQILGFKLQAEKIKEGSSVYKAMTPSLEINIIESKSKLDQVSPSVSFRIQVESIKNIFDKIKSLSFIEILLEPEELYDGYLVAIIKDQEGRSIELMEMKN